MPEPSTSPKVKSAPEKIAISLESVRSKLGKIIQGRFPDYINNDILWKDQSRYMAKSVEETDPTLIQFCKHCLLLLEDAERIAHIFQEFTNRSLARKVIGAGSTLYNAYYIYKHEFSIHLDALTKMSKEVDLPQSIRDSIDVITETFTGLNLDQLRAGTIPAGAKQISSKLDKEFLNLMDTYVEYQRPSAPDAPEKKYDLPKEKKSEDKRSEVVRVLKPATALLEPINTGLLFAAKVHNRLDIIIREEKSRGVYTPEEIAYIEKTTLALRNPPINKKGFISLKEKEGVEETRLSEALKTGFNLVWSINQICTNPESAGVLTYLGAVKAAKPYLDKLKKLMLETDGMSENMKALYETSIKAMLGECRDLIFPSIKDLVKKIHDFELQNHLRYGALLDEVRPVFDPIEILFTQWGVPVTNPLGIAETQETAIAEKAKTIKENYDNNHIENSILQFVSRQLKLILHHGTVTKKDLIKHLDYLKNSPDIKAADRSAIDTIQINLIANLTAQERAALFKSLNTHPERDKYEELRKKLQSPSDAKLMTAIPITQLKRVIALVEEKGKAFAKIYAASSLANQSVLDEQQQRVKIHMEFFTRTLATQGPNYFLCATRAAADDKHAKVNLKQKRILARLLADYENKDPITYLSTAHTVATDFLKHPEKMKKMALDIYSGKVMTTHPSLGHEMAIELILAGYINPGDWGDNQILSTENPNLARKDLINAMSRLESSQLTNLFESAAKGNQNALKRLGLFTLLISNTSLPTEKINKLLSEPSPPAPPMTEWVSLFVARYNQLASELSEKEKHVDKRDLNTWRLIQPERRLMNAIGLFLGRIAHTNAEVAKIVFKQGANIVKAECLVQTNKLFLGQDTSDLLQTDVVHSDKALYHESLVLTLSFDIAHTHRTFETLVEKNQAIVQAMHRELGSERKELQAQSPAQVIDFYKKNPLALAQLTERFIKTCLSPGSQGETQLREFFSAMALDSKVIREEMFKVFQRMGRSTRAPYIELLSESAAGPFWKKLQADIHAKSDTYLIEFKPILNHMNPLLNALSESARKKLTETMTDFVAEQNKKIKKTLGELQKTEKDILLGCYYTQQKIDEITRLAEQQKNSWSKEILTQMAIEFKKELTKSKSESIKKLTHLMEDKCSKEFQQKMAKAMESYHPEAELDAALSSSLINHAGDSAKTMADLIKRKSEIQAATEKQFHTWLEDIASNITIHADIKALHPAFKKLTDIFKKLDPHYQELKIIPTAFTHSDKFWEDAGKFYGAIESMQATYAKTTELKHGGTKKADSLVEKSFQEMRAHAYPGLEMIGQRLQQQLKKLIAGNRPDLIASLIQHFPEQKIESNLGTRVALARYAIKSLNTITGLRALLTQLPVAEDEFKQSMTTQINDCFAKQNEIAINPQASRSQIDKLQLDLNEKLKQLTHDIMQHHSNHLRKNLTAHFAELKHELLSNMEGKVNTEFQKKMLAKIDKIDPAKSLDSLAHQVATIEDAKQVIPRLATLAREQTESIDKQFQSWATDIESKTKIVNRDVYDLRKALELITKILSDYLEAQGRFAFIYSALNLPLRGQKMGMASECLTKIRVLDQTMDESPDKLSECSKELISHIQELDRKHSALIKDTQKSGTLGEAITKIRVLEKPIEEKRKKELEDEKADVRSSSEPSRDR